MKQIFTLFASLLLTISLLAADVKPKSLLTIRSVDQGDIRVIIDGRRFEPNGSYMRIRDMKPGYHNIKIYRERSQGIFTIFGNRYDMVFNNSIVVKPQTSVTIAIDRFGRARVNETRMGGRNFDFDDRDWKRDNDYDFDRGRNYGDYGNRDREWNDRDSRQGRNPRIGNDGRYGNDVFENDRDRNNNGGYGNGGFSSSKAISDYEFDRVLDNISKERFENNMMKSATQVISTNYFTSDQVKDLLQIFSFENNKLELAKLAYNKTVDQRNFHIVNDVFSHSSSRDELARFIRSH